MQIDLRILRQARELKWLSPCWPSAAMVDPFCSQQNLKLPALRSYARCTLQPSSLGSLNTECRSGSRSEIDVDCNFARMTVTHEKSLLILVHWLEASPLRRGSDNPWKGDGLIKALAQIACESCLFGNSRFFQYVRWEACWTIRWGLMGSTVLWTFTTKMIARSRRSEKRPRLVDSRMAESLLWQIVH